MKKKYTVPSKDKKDWMNFIKEMDDVRDKEVNLNKQNQEINKTRKLDLHGNSLTEANKIVRKFIIESFNKGERKLLIVTGKGSRSKSYENPYVSEKLSVLKYSIPDYIKNDKDLSQKIHKIENANPKDGGEGAISIFLKANRNL